MRLLEMLAYEFVRNAVLAAILASLLCGLVGTFVVVKRLVFISGGVSHAAFGGLGICHFLGLPPLAGAGAAAVLAAVLVSRGDRQGGRTRDAMIGILWAVGMAVGVVFIARTPGYAPNLTSYLFGDILAVSRPLLVATAVLVAIVIACVALLFKELVAVSFDEEYARAQGLPVRRLLTLLMVLIAFSVVLLIQIVGVILAIALLTIPPTISLSRAHTFRGVILLATLLGVGMTLGGLALSFAWDLPSGPTIVLLGFAMLVASNALQALATRRALAVLALAALGLSTSACQPRPRPEDGHEQRATAPRVRRLELLGEATIPRTPLDGVVTGGLSGLAYDARRGLYYAISDDRSERGPARFYTLEIDLSDGRLEEGDARVTGWSKLLTGDGLPFAEGTVDPEGIALTSRDTLIVSSEGNADAGLAPFLREFSLGGKQLDELPITERYLPREGRFGVRNNLAFEAVGLTPDGGTLFTVTENALAQDGPISTVGSSSPGRILEYDLDRRELAAEYLYRIEPVAEAPDDDAFHTAGAVEIIALDQESLLVLERSFTLGRGNDIRIWEVDLSGATDILELDSLADDDLNRVRAAAKRLLLHIDALGLQTDNIEGMTFGPQLADGSPTLVLIADDNFNPVTQRNQVLAFALRDDPTTIPEIQGRGHRSPYEGDWVRGIEGVVTAVDADPRYGGFWLQGAAEDDDRPDGASRGLFIHWPGAEVRAGDRLSVDGAVREVGRPGQLTLTRIDAGAVETFASGEPLPEPVLLGAAGRVIPDRVDDDGLQEFEPCCDAIDFFESLEGMRVRVDRPVAISGTSRNGEVVVAPDGGERLAARTGRGGARLVDDHGNPGKVALDDRLAADPPEIAVGDLFRAPVTGVLDYSFGDFKLLVEAWPAGLREQGSSTEPLPPREPRTLTVASYNVLNLAGLDEPWRFERVAASIVADLGSPDLVGLQEIQDDNGGRDEGVGGASQTMHRLLEAIVAAGGPRYDYRQIDPLPNADGGEPHGNIRVVWLFEPTRIEWIDRGTAGATDSLTVRRAPDGRAELSLSPGRIAAGHPAFVGDPERGWESSRKCLAGEIVFRGERLFLVNCHLKSKWGDEALFGSIQPPTRHSEVQRLAQVEQLLRFVRDVLAIESQAGIIVLGDMNEHEFRAPMRRLGSGDLVNLIDHETPAERYSFNYAGNSQVLDHILVSTALADRAGGLRYVHINADFADHRRASDHDPVLAWLGF